MQTDEVNALITVAALAAFSDGQKSDTERVRFQEVIGQLGVQGVDARAIVTQVLLGKADLASACAPLVTPELRALAYEFAVCLCDADGASSEPERVFLQLLRSQLQLEPAAADQVFNNAESLASLPALLPSATTEPPALPVTVSAPSPSAVDPSPMILNYAMLCAGLELLPQGLANLAILPLQMKMVYRVGLAHGFPLDRGHIVELLGVLGLSATGQMLEGVARKFLGKLGGAVAGGLGKMAARGVTGAALTFATTYALGHVAHRYYGGGRRLDRTALQGLFGELKSRAATLYPQYAGKIQAQSSSINVTDILRGRDVP